MYDAYPFCSLLCFLFVCLFIYACSVVLHERAPTWQRINMQSCLGGFSTTTSIDGMKQRSHVAGEREGPGTQCHWLTWISHFGPPVPYQSHLLVQLKHLEVCSPPSGTGMKNSLQVKHRQYLCSAARRGA